MKFNNAAEAEFWKQVFLQAMSPTITLASCCAVADASLAEYRQRIPVHLGNVMPQKG